MREKPPDIVFAGATLAPAESQRCCRAKKHGNYCYASNPLVERKQSHYQSIISSVIGKVNKILGIFWFSVQKRNAIMPIVFLAALAIHWSFSDFLRRKKGFRLTFIGDRSRITIFSEVGNIGVSQVFATVLVNSELES